MLQLLLFVLLYLGCPLRIRPAAGKILEIKSKVHESEREICCHILRVRPDEESEIPYVCEK